METLELIQKHPLKGRREFKLDDEEIHYIISSPLRGEDALSVALCVLDAKPVVNGSILEFVSQINKEPLLEFFIDRPDKPTFDRFVNTLQKRIADEDFGRFYVADGGVNVDVGRLDESISLLKQYVEPAGIEPLLATLFALREQPDDVRCQRHVVAALNELGFVQGQVITYAPYLAYLLSGNGEQSGFLE